MDLKQTADLLEISAGAASAEVSTTGKIHLIQSNLVLDLTRPLADYQLADFPGYSAQTVGTQGTPYLRGIVYAIPIPGKTWQAASNITQGQTIYGAILTDNGGTTLLAAGNLDTPQTVLRPGDVVRISADLLTGPG